MCKSVSNLQGLKPLCFHFQSVPDLPRLNFHGTAEISSTGVRLKLADSLLMGGLHSEKEASSKAGSRNWTPLSPMTLMILFQLGIFDASVYTALGVELDNIQRSFPNPTIPWFCGFGIVRGCPFCHPRAPC